MDRVQANRSSNRSSEARSDRSSIGPLQSFASGWDRVREAITRERVNTETFSVNYEEAFALIDKDGSGTITRIKVIKACRNEPRVRQLLQLPESIRQEDGTRDAFEKVFQRMDKDNKKAVDFHEFVAFWQVEVRRAAWRPFAPLCVAAGRSWLEQAPARAPHSLSACDLPWRLGAGVALPE